MRIGRVLAVLATLAALMGAFTVVTATSGATGPPPAAESWVGWVERHGDHHDYSGSPCSEQSGDFCTANVVQYRIVPANPAIAGELSAREGQRTRLWGTLERVSDSEHAGVLTVEKVEPASS